jgi:hypothetical protein
VPPREEHFNTPNRKVWHICLVVGRCFVPLDRRFTNTSGHAWGHNDMRECTYAGQLAYLFGGGAHANANTCSNKHSNRPSLVELRVQLRMFRLNSTDGLSLHTRTMFVVSAFTQIRLEGNTIPRNRSVLSCLLWGGATAVLAVPTATMPAAAVLCP